MITARFRQGIKTVGIGRIFPDFLVVKAGPMIVSKTEYVICVAAFLSLILGGWLFMRANSFGLNNVFSRERRFHDERPLTEDLAIELTRRTLDRDGYDTSRMTTVEYRTDFPEGHLETVFSRSSLTPNDGYVLWGPRSEQHPDVARVRTFLVTIEKSGSEYRCRALRRK